MLEKEGWTNCKEQSEWGWSCTDLYRSHWECMGQSDGEIQKRKKEGEQEGVPTGR